MNKHSDTAASTGPTRPYVELFLISFLLLFFELACIRWFGSTVVFLTFFTNIVLLATFLGMSVGCLAATSRRDWTRAVMPLLALSVVLACGTLWSYNRFGHLLINVGGQGSPQQVYFGTEYRARDVAAFAVPIELLAGIFFVLIALMFVGVGQVMGRAFNRAADRLAAYISNIAGSLAGIAVFALASYLMTPPLIWFTVVGVMWIVFLRHRTMPQIGAAVVTLLLVAVTGYNGTPHAPFRGPSESAVLLWSPYYKIQYLPDGRRIQTNNIGHQRMVPIDGQGPAYHLPHLLNRDAGGKPFENVLIIGAGSGNDVAAALAHGARHVDAVEIDPAIYNLGRAEHPNHPYQDPRVTVFIDDGRSFLRKTDRHYDLIVYALVDSLVMHSGYSSLRLESFLFTQEAFDEIAGRLTPGGLFAAYNFFRQGWIVGRIDQMAEQAFHAKPLVMALPYVDRIRPSDAQAYLTFILTGSETGLSAIRRQFVDSQSFWVHQRPLLNGPVNAYGAQPPTIQDSTSTDWNRIAPAEVDTSGIDRVATDDWPFLYLKQPLVPELNVRSTLLLGVLSLVILSVISPVKVTRPNWQMFFLGAGFMLLETKGVVHMALLFGSTWIVNSIVFFAILLMVLASNLTVLALQPRRLWPYYALLAAALVINILVPMRWFLSLPGSERVVLSCAVTFVPIFFAGIIFGALFRDSTQPDVDFGSNIAGAILGGFAESLSLLFGFNYLLALALVFYLLSGALRRPIIVPIPISAGS
jgi:SAM-dependent methyltransferase